MKQKKVSNYVKKKRKTEIGLWREWLVPDGAYRRYKGLRGIYWYWLSRDVRKSEWERWNKLCLTCLNPVSQWEDGDCGHVIPSSICGEYLRFYRLNLTLQHKGCNNPKFSPLAPALNAINYDKRHGIGAYEKLLALKGTPTREPSQAEYRLLIRALPSYQAKLQSP